jgi:abortive infection bacteriophage resistance protein
MKYTNEDWKGFKKHFEITNKDVSEIIGVEKHSVDVATMPKNKKLPVWARLAIWTFKQLKNESDI